MIKKADKCNNKLILILIIITIILIIIILILNIKNYKYFEYFENKNEKKDIIIPKIFTIVKDEDDIIEDWIKYHGYIVGYNNIYIIDNYSSDGTWEKINEYKGLINIYREKDYKKKGIYMKKLIDENCIDNQIAFPIDIDEFIVYYDKKKLSANRDIIINYINNLPKSNLYKMNYINPILIDKEYGHKKATQELNYGILDDSYGNQAKSFFNKSLYKGNIDHGNHMVSDDYYLSNLCLVHYHQRNIEQIKKKILNNILGLGYKNDLDYLKNLLINNPKVAGFHHVINQIDVLQGNFKLHTRNNMNKDIDINSNKIDINPLRKRIIVEYN